MTSPAASTVLFLIVSLFAGGANAATFTFFLSAAARSSTRARRGPSTCPLAEFSIDGDQDFYDIALIDGYNLAMACSCSVGVGL
uniref:Hydrophobic seed protein domain-containing protein n=1 Tax=Setaria italica TaxID=4555 RepID=K3ZD50_SETIT